MTYYDEHTIRSLAEKLTGLNFWVAGDIRFSDGPAGLRVQKGSGDSMGLKKAEPATCFPTHTALASSWNRSLSYDVARLIGEEAASHGVDILLAPAVNLKRNPYNGRNFEYFSEDCYLSGELGAAFVGGVQSTGVGACVKHFALNNKEDGRSVSDSVVSERTLNELYLHAFEAVIKKASPASVMTSYNKLNGIYCNQHAQLIQGILRERWGFEGFVLSDWGGTYDRPLAIKAGADLEMPGCPISTDEIVEAWKRGELSGEEISACADRIAKACTRPKPAKTQYDRAKHAEFARTAAEQCAVLLKNDGTLPLSADTRVAVFGRAAEDAPVQGGGSSHVIHNSSVQTILSALSEECSVTGLVGRYGAINGSARRLLKKSDIALVCLAAYAGDSEGMDKKSLSLPEEQIELVKSLQNCGKKVVCVLTSGGAVDTSWDSSVNSLLYLPLAGQGTACAVAKILCGKVNPSGKLAESFFNSPEELPSTVHFNESPYHTLYREGCAVGYRYYLAAGIKPKYAFGHGLSYTQFEYSEPTVSADGVQFTITNTGDTDGAEIAQIYAEFPQSANDVAPKLIGFEKVLLKVGESARVRVSFSEDTFRSYDTDLHDWVTVSGEYLIRVAKSSEEVLFTIPLNIVGNSTGVPADCFPNVAPAEHPITRNKRGRTVIELSTPFIELTNSRALLVRIAAKSALYFTRNNPTLSGTLRYSPVRTGAQFAGFNTRQAEGLIDAFNGRYMRGIWKIITKKRGTKKS